MTAATKKIITRCQAEARANENGEAEITTKEVAQLIRQRLRDAFPAVKFKVRKEGYNAVYVSWDRSADLSQTEVCGIVDAYQFGGFDGMIDYAYSGKNWLLPDGTMTPASVENTQRCGGYVPGLGTDCPVPGAVVVKYGPRYIIAQAS